MKKIKTLSSISLVTTLLGLGMPLLNPISTINANEMGEMQMGAPIDLDVPTPNVEDFNNENATAKTNNTMSIQAWPTPTYNSTDHSWHFLNGEGSVYGSASAAFKRAISTKENFTIEADSFITSDSQWKYSTDTIGIVLSTASSDKLAESQTDGQKSKAGYANPDVAWQTMIGSQPFVDWTDNWLVKKSSHREFIRRTIKGAQRQLDGKDFGQDPSTAGPLDSTYSVTYDAGTRELTYKTKRGAQATDTLPDGINELYVGFLSDIQGSGEHDVTRMQLKTMSASYVKTHTTVHFVNKDDSTKSLGKDTTINGIVGQDLSISGNAVNANGYYWTAPNIKHATLSDGPEDKAARTILTKPLVTMPKDSKDDTPNVINVVYSRPVGTLPYEIVDDDDPHSAVNSKGTIPLKVNSRYDYTLSSIVNDVDIPDGTYPVSLKNQTGIVTENSDNQVTNDAVIIHVKHSLQKVTTEFTRNIHFVGPNGMKGLPRTLVKIRKLQCIKTRLMAI